MKHILFYALKEDLLPVLDAVEQKGPLKYVRTGMFPTADLMTFGRGSEIPNLGKANDASAIGCDSFLVTEPTTPVRVRPVDTVEGRRYCVDQLLNPDTVTFTPAGLWSEGIVLYGRVATVSESGPAQELMKRFRSAIKKRFSKVKAYFVGPGALDILKSGGRLTLATQTPREYDLKIS